MICACMNAVRYIGMYLYIYMQTHRHTHTHMFDQAAPSSFVQLFLFRFKPNTALLDLQLVLPGNLAWHCPSVSVKKCRAATSSDEL